MEPVDRPRRVPGVNRTVTVKSTGTSTGPTPPAGTAAAPVARFPLTFDHDFEAFYADARDALARALTVTLGQRDLAVEAVDEAMARAFQRWPRVATLDNPGGWVYRVALNWATSVLRRRRRPVPAVLRPDASVVDPAPPEPAVLAAMAELDVRHRAVVVCRHLLGWSEAETAAALSTPAGTVKSRLHRAHRILAARLSHLREEEC